MSQHTKVDQRINAQYACIYIYIYIYIIPTVCIFHVHRVTIPKTVQVCIYIYICRIASTLWNFTFPMVISGPRPRHRVPNRGDGNHGKPHGTMWPHESDVSCVATRYRSWSACHRSLHTIWLASSQGKSWESCNKFHGKLYINTTRLVGSPSLSLEAERRTLQGINISHLGKRKIIFNMPFWGDMLVPWRVAFASLWGLLAWL